MDEKSVTIITGSGKELGTGHFQRMLNLASFINSSGIFHAFFLHNDNSKRLPVFPDIITVREIPEDTSLIIRDMRDSSPADICKLREKAPVMVIDDAGEGRFSADYRIDLLPGPYNIDLRDDLFLYGYNFTESLKPLKNKFIEKSNDLLIYQGALDQDGYMEKIIENLPPGITYTISGKTIPGEKSSYAETLISTKVVVTHFGIMLYEAFLSSCHLAVINPSPYHDMLTDKASGILPLVNLGQVSQIDCKAASDSLVKLIKSDDETKIEVIKIYEQIFRNLTNFHSMISEIIN